MEEFVDLPSGKQLATDVDVDVRYFIIFFCKLNFPDELQIIILNISSLLGDPTVSIDFENVPVDKMDDIEEK